MVVSASLITAFYMTRLYFRVFEGPAQDEHLHEGHLSMVAPMVALATVTALLGFGSVRFAEFLGHEGEWPSLFLVGVSVTVAVLGIGTGWWVYGRRSVVVNTRVYKDRMGLVYTALSQKLYFDLAYEVLFIRPYIFACKLLASFDLSVIDGIVNGVARGWIIVSSVSWKFDASVIDGAVNGLASLTRESGAGLRKLQSGRIQSYQRLVFSAVVALMICVVIYVVVKGA